MEIAFFGAFYAILIFFEGSGEIYPTITTCLCVNSDVFSLPVEEAMLHLTVEKLFANI
jgi:hypothetical protein